MTREPDFISQTFEPMSPQEAQAWFIRHIEAHKAKGAVVSRAVIGEEGAPYEGGHLLESWLERPKDQGEPHWQMVRP